jgi:hypothetical protein
MLVYPDCVRETLVTQDTRRTGNYFFSHGILCLSLKCTGKWPSMLVSVHLLGSLNIYVKPENLGYEIHWHLNVSPKG